MDFLPSTLYMAPQDGAKATSLMSSKPQKKYTRCMPPTAVQLPPPSKYGDDDDVEDDFPTPRANQNIPSQENISQPLTSPGYPEEWKARLSSTHTEFEEDDIYGTVPSDDEYSMTSDDDSEIVPFKVSNSIRKLLKKPSHKADPRLSVVIPSPAMWPTVDKLQRSDKSGDDLPLSPQIPLSPAALARLAANNALLIPGQSNTPSLAESITSDGVSSLSCPSTPDLRSKGDEEEEVEWELPMQLHPAAMETLLNISPDCESEDGSEIIVHATIAPAADQNPPPPMAERGLKISLTIPVSSPELNEDEFSALSVPSPGGFFASLGDSSSQVWAFPKPNSEPSTSTAETFYNVPWRKPPPQPLQRVVELEEALSDGPPTARRITEEMQSTSAATANEPITEGIDYDTEYERKLHESATANMSRTSIWLATQESYLASLNGETSEDVEKTNDACPKTPVSSISSQTPVDDASTMSPASKKSVRFADDETKSTTSSGQSGSSVSSDALFYHAFQHTCKNKTGKDAFTNREVRAEAVRAERHYLPSVHRARLTNTFALAAPKDTQKGNESWRVGPTDAKAEEQRDMLAHVNKEQQALQQISLSSFYLDADRFLNQGTLFPQAIANSVKQKSSTKSNPRILDLGGEPTASWGWAVALEYRDAKVFTAVPASQGQNATWTAHRGPSNHRTVTVPNAWTLPFRTASFDVVSARTLHSILRNSSPTRDGGDEYDATLAEIKRVLSPGGYFHFSVMDAEVTAPANTLIASRSIEFAVSLRTRGYEPSAGRKLVAKMDKAGFGDVRRSWMSLPIGGADPNGMAAVTGLYGSLAWEKWMLKLQMETGRPEERLLDGIAKAFDEAKESKEGASWRMLVGCAQKC